MKILITGGAGYIGSVLTIELLRLNHNVTVLDNFLYQQTSLNYFCRYNSFNVINGDIRDKDLIKKCLQEHLTVIPLAALVGAPICSKKPFEAFSINYEANKS